MSDTNSSSGGRAQRVQSAGLTSPTSPPTERALRYSQGSQKDPDTSVGTLRRSRRGNSEKSISEVKAINTYEYTSPLLGPIVGSYMKAPNSPDKAVVLDMEVLTPFGLEAPASLNPPKPVFQMSETLASSSRVTTSPRQTSAPLSFPGFEIPRSSLPSSATFEVGRPATSGGGLLNVNSQARPASSSTATTSGLDTLLQPAKLNRETEINFIKLDEYIEGLAHKFENKSKSLSRQAKSDFRINIEDFKTVDKRFMYYSIDTGPYEAKTFGELAAYRPLQELLRSRCFWLDVCTPTVDEMKLFGSVFNIHPLTIEDIMTDGTREKFELYKSYYFICYCAFDQDAASPTYMQSFNVYILIYADFVLSFHYYPLMTVKTVVRRLDQLKSYMKVTPHWINYAILDDITDKYQPLIASLELEVDTIDDLILVITQSEQSDMLRRMANARKRVTTLQRLLVLKSDVIRMLMKRIEGMATGTTSTNAELAPAYMAMLRDTLLYLGDVQDHVITMVQTLAHIDSTLNRCHSNYLAQVNIEITQTSYQSGTAVAKLTALASILVPLNIITGLWGMNVTVPGNTADNPSLNWFFGILTVMILIVLVGFAAIRWMGLVGEEKK